MFPTKSKRPINEKSCNCKQWKQNYENFIHLKDKIQNCPYCNKILKGKTNLWVKQW